MATYFLPHFIFFVQKVPFSGIYHFEASPFTIIKMPSSLM